QLQLSNGNAHPVRTQVAESQDSAGVGDADESHVLLRPVAQHLFDAASSRHRQVHAARLAVDVSKLQAGFANRGVLVDRKKAGGGGHDPAIEQRFFVIEEIDQINVALEVCRFLCQLRVHASQLEVFSLDDIGDETNQAERFPLGLAEPGGLVQGRVAQYFHSAFCADGHGDLAPFYAAVAAT